MNYLDWHVGMKVVCVDADFGALSDISQANPEVGGVYTIAEIYAVKIGDRTGPGRVATEDFTSIRLDEFGKFEAFDCDHFRPVQTRKTDISLFRAMLTDTKTKVPA